MYGKLCILIFCNFLLLLLLLPLNDSNSRKNVLYLYLCIIIKKFSGIYVFFFLPSNSEAYTYFRFIIIPICLLLIPRSIICCRKFYLLTIVCIDNINY